jgi:Mn2+/Fe2+ NRAMP family transporter
LPRGDTGAADDDPSGISTYSVTGAAYGYATLWVALLTFPLMTAVQLNGLLAPPLILLVILLTSSRKVMGPRTNPTLLKSLGWVTFAIMTAAAVGMLIA